MEARELRIGNFVDCNGIVSEIVEVRTNYVRLKYFRKDVEKEHISLVELDGRVKEIPLTEEWLLKFGFDNKFNKDKFTIIPKGKLGYENGRTYFNSWTILEKQPDYVHQLQNLYFALTGEELTFKNQE